MEEENKGFIFFKSYYEAIKNLDATSQYKILNAIIQYALYGIEPKNDADFDAKIAPIFILIKPTIDSSIKRYSACVSNGKKGRSPKR